MRADDRARGGPTLEAYLEEAQSPMRHTRVRGFPRAMAGASRRHTSCRWPWPAPLSPRAREKGCRVHAETLGPKDAGPFGPGKPPGLPLPYPEGKGLEGYFREGKGLGRYPGGQLPPSCLGIPLDLEALYSAPD
ncbi:MAG: hypothetical protein ACK4G4_05075 [Thermus sp.]|uniref:hypothetical protein n=1 Tax=Thermus sp. TaxID=275 RepID=UPI00391D4F98